MLSEGIRSRFPPYQCPCCGSNWFRDESFVELPEEIWPYELKDLVSNSIGVLVCLCGKPVPPSLQGVRDPTRERFRTSQNRTEQRSKAHLLAEFRTQVAAARTQLPALQERMRKLERVLGQKLAAQRVASGQRKAPGRHWQLPRTTPASSQGATKGREWLVRELQKRGFTFRKARAAVEAVFQVIEEGLREDRSVKTPMGEFYLTSRTPSYDRWRWGHHQEMHKQRLRVVFEPESGLLDGKTDKTKRKV